MKNYRDSDYAANKYTSGIVYRSVTDTYELTLEDYLRENPGATEADFAELKALSDEIYLEQDRADYRQTHKDVSLHGLDEPAACCVPSLEEVLIDRPEREKEREHLREQAHQALLTLTEVQRRRYLLHRIDGLTTREIAEKEGISHVAVVYSLEWAEKKIEKFLAAAKK